MLIDEYMPVYVAAERHELIVPAAPADVYAAIRMADFGKILLIRWLLSLRHLPARLAGLKGKQLSRDRYTLTLDTFLGNGFHLLAEEPGKEIAIGLVGRFWTLSGELDPIDPATFTQLLKPGKAKAVWNFHVHEVSQGRTLLATETRVHCADAASLWSFRCYWFVIRPFSGAMRRLMLRAIRQSAVSAESSC